MRGGGFEHPENTVTRSMNILIAPFSSRTTTVPFAKRAIGDEPAIRLGHRKSARFIPCAVVNSLLITFLRAAECTASRISADHPTLFRASPCFENAPKRGAIHWARTESISWGMLGAHPNRDDKLQADGHANWQPRDEFAPTFFEGKRRCKHPTSTSTNGANRADN